MTRDRDLQALLDAALGAFRRLAQNDDARHCLANVSRTLETVCSPTDEPEERLPVYASLGAILETVKRAGQPLIRSPRPSRSSSLARDGAANTVMAGRTTWRFSAGTRTA
jgi:hypothetical protein